MSATSRKEKLMRLSMEIDMVREERNAMIRANAELLGQIDALKKEVEAAKVVVEDSITTYHQLAYDYFQLLKKIDGQEQER